MDWVLKDEQEFIRQERIFGRGDGKGKCLEYSFQVIVYWVILEVLVRVEEDYSSGFLANVYYVLGIVSV